jgi:transglutaminase-like putative cysteine protease
MPHDADANARLFFPQFDWGAVTLAVMIVLCAACSLVMAEWMPELDQLITTVVVAGVVVSLLATRRWRASVVFFLSVLYGVVWVMFLAISVMPDKVYGWTLLDSVRHLVVRLGEHIYLWLEAVLAGGVGTDNVIFLMALAAAFWLITYLAVWNTIRRQRLWWTIAPSGLILLINLYYYGGGRPLALWLVAYLFAVLLYATRLYTLRQRRSWQFGRVHFEPEVGRDFLQIGAIIATVAVIFGAALPSFAGAPQISGLWREISRPIRSIEDTFSRLFSGLEPHGMPYANPFGRTLALLGQRNLGNELVMEVRSPEGRYWQAVVYDRYTGGAFQSSDPERLSLSANELRPVQFEQRALLTQTVTVYFPNNSLIFAAPQPVAVNQTSWLDMLPGNEISMWTVLTPFGPGDNYRVVSAVSHATIEQLRQAGDRYPPEITARYLQLPGDLPDRVRQLARQIVSDADAITPYDQAAALEAWLRQNIKYNDQIPAPAQGQDGVDYVLFGAKEGYCDYYASAMAVLARSLGLPARVVTGFAQGSTNERTRAFEVYQYNAHTWAEVYFPRYGWIQFEPTASQPVIARPLPELEADSNRGATPDAGPPSRAGGREVGEEDEDVPSDRGGAGALSGSNFSPIATWLLVGSTLALGAAGCVLAGIWWYENRSAPRQASGGAWGFARLSRLAVWLRVRQAASHTPFERAHLIGQAVPQRRVEIEELADAYVRERYGRDQIEAAHTRSIWQRTRWAMWRAGLKRRLPRLSFRRRPHDRV